MSSGFSHSSAPIAERIGTALLIGFLAYGFCSSVAADRDSDPLSGIKSFSDLARIDLGKLHGGEILGEPGALMSYPNGFWAETCFAVAAAPKEVATRLLIWDPSLQPTLKALEFQHMSEPCGEADLKRLTFNPNSRPTRWLLEKSLATTARKSELNLSRAVAQQLSDFLKGKSTPDAVARCWSKLLLERATAFQRAGFGGVVPYELGGASVSPLVCTQEMMRERPKVAQEFAPLLREVGVLGGAKPGTLKAFYYWGLYEANSRATLSLGAVYLLPLGDRYQLVDAQYYVSATYYTSLTLYEVWPSPIGQKPGAVVWRGDFFAGPSLAYTKGVERLAYGAVVLKELKKTIRSFQEDIHHARGQEAPKPLP